MYTGSKQQRYPKTVPTSREQHQRCRRRLLNRVGFSHENLAGGVRQRLQDAAIVVSAKRQA